MTTIICTKNVGFSTNDRTLYTHVIFLMGCAPSSQTKREVIGNETNLMDAYLRVEREISQEEQKAPASILGHIIAKLEKINFDLEKLTTDAGQSHVNYDHVLNKFQNVESENPENIDESIRSVMTELHVMNNPKLAAEHEEFIANLNRKILKCRQIYLLNRRKVELEEEAVKLGERIQNLHNLYEQQSIILSEIFSASYSSKTESELDRLRKYRDALMNGQIAWQDAIRLIQSASMFAQAGLNSWQTIHITSSDESKFKLATETRNAIQEAALLIQDAQSILLAVQFPYCTQREIFAVLQVIKYLYTDMQIPERYEHTKEVYKSFYKRSSALSKWLQELMNSTICKDMEEVESKIAEFVSKLNSERIIQIKKKTSNVGLANGIVSSDSLNSLDTLHQKSVSQK